MLDTIVNDCSGRFMKLMVIWKQEDCSGVLSAN